MISRYIFPTIQTFVKNTLIVLLIMCFGACSLLDIEPASSVTEETFYTTLPEAEAALLGIYAYLATDDLYGQQLSIIYPSQSDESRHSSTTLDDGKGGLVNYYLNEKNKELVGSFNTLYKAIAWSNVVIEKIQGMQLYREGTVPEQATLKRYLGEAMMLRALFYFDLVKIWGDVPFVTEPTDIHKSATEYMLPRTSRDTIYDYIIADMQKVIANRWLWTWSEAGKHPERFTDGAARGILARICLHAAGYSLRWDLQAYSKPLMAKRQDQTRINQLYSIVRAQTDSVINSNQHALNPDYERVFKNYMEGKVDTYGESMLEVGFTFANNTGGGRIGVLNSGRQSEYSSYGKGAGEILSLPSTYIMYEPATAEKSIRDADGNPIMRKTSDGSMLPLNDFRWSHDKRRDVAVCIYQISDTNTFVLRASTDYTAGKWRRHWMSKEQLLDKDRTSVNWVLLRYADVLLMNAEANFYLGDHASARAKVNEVRHRAYGFPKDNTRSDVSDYVWSKPLPEANASDNLSYAIVKERMLELCFEGLRKYDLIRWNLLSAYVSKAKSGMEEFKNNDGTNVAYPYLLENPGNASWSYRINALQSFLNFQDLLININLGKGESPYVAAGVADYAQDKIDWSHKYFEVNKHELYPIPRSAIDANLNLKQCPAY